MHVQLLRNIIVNKGSGGVPTKKDTIVDLPKALALDLIAQRSAKLPSDEPQEKTKGR